MEASLERALVAAYALNFRNVAQTLIDLMKPKVSPAELRYLETDGPQIVKAYFQHDMLSEWGGCSEGRAALRSGKFLEKEAEEYLTQAGVSAERQLLLLNLTFSAALNYHLHYAPKKIANVEYHMTSSHHSGKLVQFKEASELFEAPEEVRAFLTELLKEASLLVKERGSMTKSA